MILPPERDASTTPPAARTLDKHDGLRALNHFLNSFIGFGAAAAIIITSDKDFYRLAGVFGFPPTVVMLRTGNQSTQFIAQLLIQRATTIAELEASGELGVLEPF